MPKYCNSIAQAYAGHQFGHFTMLGDGRAVLIGEHVSKNKDRYDIQFKGSGKTAFSRNGDGRAALGPMLREYLISEAMHALNIPTTRSLALAKTGESVIITPLFIGVDSSRPLKKANIFVHIPNIEAVSYTHLTLPTNREV